MVNKFILTGKSDRWGPWENKRLHMKIKYWEGNETGGYDVYKNGKKLNKIWISSYSKALKFARKYI